jgi:predicted P-loop ATPase/GTPase
MNCTTVLVNGLLTYDSGKTYVATALVKALIERGFKVSAFKPLAGHSAWYQFNTVLYSLRCGTLIGEDVLKYKELLSLGPEVELVNPVDLLLAPLDPNCFENVEDYLHALTNQLEQLIMARVSDCRNGAARYYVIEDNASRVVLGLRPWVEKLVERFKPEPITARRFFADVLASHSMVELLDCAFDVLRSRADVLVVESFNDAAVPYMDLLSDVDVVLTVTPGCLFKLDPEDFKRIVKSSYSKLGERGLALGSIFDEIDVKSRLFLPVVSSVNELTTFISRYLEPLLSR